MSRFTRTLVPVALAFFAMLPGVAAAKPVTDCPLRDAPFSAQSPLIDILLNPQAKAILEKTSGRSLDKAPPAFIGTKPPTFAAILTMRSAAMFTGLKPEAVPEIDAALRKLPVTAADKIARCERYDNDVPKFDPATGKPRVLLFEKITGFRDSPSGRCSACCVHRNGKAQWLVS